MVELARGLPAQCGGHGNCRKAASVVVVVRYGALCLESFSASVGDDPLPILSQLA